MSRVANGIEDGHKPPGCQYLSSSMGVWKEDKLQKGAWLAPFLFSAEAYRAKESF